MVPEGFLPEWSPNAPRMVANDPRMVPEGFLPEWSPNAPRMVANGPRMVPEGFLPEWSPNGPRRIFTRMVPEWCPNGPRMVPEWSPNGPPKWSPNGPRMVSEWLPNGPVYLKKEVQKKSENPPEKSRKIAPKNVQKKAQKLFLPKSLLPEWSEKSPRAQPPACLGTPNYLVQTRTLGVSRWVFWCRWTPELSSIKLYYIYI